MNKLYEEYNRVNNSDVDIEDKINVLNNIIRKNPKLIDYLFNKVDSCFGTHKVYVAHMRYKGLNMIKIGYTKNDVKTRFAEKRYSGIDNLGLVEIIREEELQAKGAVDFECELKEMFKNCKIKTDITFPGKGEMYEYSYKENIIEGYDNHIKKHKNTVGLKSPN